MEGYNVALKVDGKTLAGRTQDDMSISAVTKDSITKDDGGNTKSTVTGHDVTFRAAGLMEVAEDSTTKLGRDEIIDLSLRKGDAAKIPFVYGPKDGAQYSGNAVITGYSESTNAQGEATYSLDLKVSGEMTKVEATAANVEEE